MRVSVGDARLFVDIVGSGVAVRGGCLVERPSVLLLHGGPGYDHTNLRSFHGRQSRLAQMIFFELVILKLRDRLGETSETMRARHTNLE